MSVTRPSTPGSIVPEQSTATPSLPPSAQTPRWDGSPRALIAIAFAVLLLVLATTSQGAFQTSRWAPLTLFTLAVLIGAVAARRAPSRRRRAVQVALTGIWGLAGWSVLSIAWAQSRADALGGACQIVFYAAIVTLPFALPLSRRALAAVGWSITAGIGAVAVWILIRLLIDATPLFLAGRLNGPIDYRNATALLFALPVWPFVIAAACRDCRRLVRASSLGLAALCTGLAFLTQSRGILLGLAAGACLALTAGPDRVRRAWVALLVLAGTAVASPWLLRPFHAFDGGHGFVGPHAMATAARALLLLTVAAFAVGMAVALFDSGLRAHGPAMRQVRATARAALALGIVLGLVAGAVAIGNPVTFARHKWDQFRDVNASTPTTTRYVSVGGQRYDLWRVALKEFAGAPVGGVGVGNYEFGYYRERATNRNLNDPHSVLFSLLSETGAVGVAFFAVFLGGTAAVMRTGWRRLTPAARRHAIAPAAAGLVLLGQSAVDWIWLIPGLTAIGLLALAVAAAQVAAPPVAVSAVAGAGEVLELEPEPRRARLSWVPRALAACLLALAAVAVLALFLSDAYINRARSVIARPPAELAAARAAARLDPWSVTPHYLEASAYETMGNRPAAYRQLRAALSLEPENSAAWGVLGDFAARGGDARAARAYYRRALVLNPLDSGLQQLARYGEPGAPGGAAGSRAPR